MVNNYLLEHLHITKQNFKFILLKWRYFFIVLNMGRKRLPTEDKKVSKTISIKEKYWKRLKELGSPSEIIAMLVKDYLRKQGKGE
jgi:hypothetical protein